MTTSSVASLTNSSDWLTSRSTPWGLAYVEIRFSRFCVFDTMPFTSVANAWSAEDVVPMYSAASLLRKLDVLVALKESHLANSRVAGSAILPPLIAEAPSSSRPAAAAAVPPSSRSRRTCAHWEAYSAAASSAWPPALSDENLRDCSFPTRYAAETRSSLLPPSSSPRPSSSTCLPVSEAANQPARDASVEGISSTSKPSESHQAALPTSFIIFTMWSGPSSSIAPTTSAPTSTEPIALGLS
mmetsp:Transcript_85661/g.262105  ORF Transcript_85661/g.262105 Transcript_85661/m.262105 type:complete len:242 (-) Transcript_85661:1026-1751(-)